MSVKPIKLFFYAAAMLALAGCIPKHDLPEPKRASAVTGPFDVYFPNAEEVFTGPETVNQVRAKQRDKEEQEIVPEKGSLNIGLLLPKTGDAATLGKDFEDAAILGLYDAKLAYPGGYRLTLIPKDTAGSPSVAVDAAESLAANDIDIYVGPLYNESTQAVVAAVRPSLLFSLSNNLEARSENAFVFGFTPESEMLRSLTYALKQNRQHVSAILPNNAYGRKLEKVIRSTTPGFGASLDVIEFYVPTAGGRRTAAMRLAERIRQIGTDTLCFGDTKENATEIIRILADNGVNVSGALKLGTSLWHNQDEPTPKELIDAVYAGSDERGYTRFMKRFKSAHGRTPERLATLVYDAVSILAKLASTGEIPTREALVNEEVIQGGAAGSYRFELDSSITRALALYSLTPTDFKVIENAPKNFK